MSTFIHEKAYYTAVLVYTSPERAASLKVSLIFSETVDLNADDASFRQLHVRTNTSYHRVLVAEKPEMMRGFDFHGEFKGITLLLDRGSKARGKQNRPWPESVGRVSRRNDSARSTWSSSTRI